MSVEEKMISDYMAFLSKLRTDLKLKLISKLTDSVKDDFETVTSTEENNWRNLFGVWADIQEPGGKRVA